MTVIEESAETDVEFSIESKPSFLLGKGKVPEDLLDDLNDMCEDLLADPDTPSYAPFLVGEIQKGRQLEVNIEDRRFRRMRKLLKDSCMIYIGQYFSSVGRAIPPYHLKISDVWTVHQYSGDYNPLHDHGSNSYSAFSGFIHTKLPPKLKKKSEGFVGSSIFNSQGTLDGITSLVWGDVGIRDHNIFKFPGTEYIVPVEGVYYIFPLWLNHCVYPFREEGERRTISYNVEVIWDDDFSENPTPSKVKLI
jgi:hypothetical protein